MDFQPGGGDPFRNGMMQADFSNPPQQYINFEYQDIIARLAKLEITANQQYTSTEEVKSMISGLESRLNSLITSQIKHQFDALQANILETLENRLINSNNSINDPSQQQDDQLSTAIFSAKGNSLSHRVSVTDSHGKNSIFDPLDIPSFNFQAYGADNFPQPSSNKSQKTLSTTQVQEGKVNQELSLSSLPVLKAITKRTNEDADGRMVPSNSKVAPFQTFFSNDEVLEGIRDGTLYLGVLTINKRNRQEASVLVDTESGPLKVLVLGENARNRSLEGDHVAVKLNDESQWETNEIGKKAIVPYRSSPSTYKLWNPSKSLVPQDIKTSDTIFSNFEQPEDNSRSFAAITSKFYPNDASPESKTLQKPSFSAVPTGRVVAILNDDKNQLKVRSITRRSGQNLVGSLVPRYGFDNPKLTKNEPLPKTENTVEFRPLDNRFPFLMIQREELPKQFVQDPFSFKSPSEKLVVCSIRGWFENFRFPLGRFMTILGDSYSIPAETEALIKETHSTRNTEPFSDKALSDLARLASSKDTKNRIDLRGETIFSISNDHDSIQLAFHCKPSSQDINLVEVGVHIADVSHFVAENSALDIEAFHRAVKITLVNTELPMLPFDLTRDICSLKPGEDRFCISIILYLTKEGELMNDKPPIFLKSVIRSCCVVSFDVAEKIVSSKRDIEFQIVGNTAKSMVIESLRTFYSLGAKRKQMRNIISDTESVDISIGKCLTLSNLTNSYRLDANGEPTNIYSVHISSIEAIVSEFETVVNFFVAEHLLSNGSQFAFLLKQSPPDIDEQDLFWQVLCLYGLPDPRSTQLNPELFVKVFQNIKAKLLPKPSESSDPVFSKVIGSIYKNFAQMDSSTAFAFLSFLLKNALPKQQFGLAENTSLAINGKVDFSDSHWLQNVPYFTSFTKPFNSYADITVHRLLELSLSKRASAKLKNPEFLNELREKLAVISNHCNTRIAQGIEAERRSNMLFLCSMVKKKTLQKKHLETPAVVLGFGQKNIFLYLLEYNQQCKVNVFVDWHASTAVTAYSDGTFVQYHTDNKDETKLIEPAKELLETTRDKAVVSMTVKLPKGTEIEVTYGLEVRILLKPQVERKRVLGFRTDFIHLVHGGKSPNAYSRRKNSRH